MEALLIMSFEQMVDLVRPHIPQALVSSESLGRIRRVAGHLPTEVARYFGFETKLLSDQTDCDFAFSLTSDGVTWMSHANTLWPRVRHFCTIWCESEVLPDNDRDAVWLEFDV